MCIYLLDRLLFVNPNRVVSLWCEKERVVQDPRAQPSRWQTLLDAWYSATCHCLLDARTLPSSMRCSCSIRISRSRRSARSAPFWSRPNKRAQANVTEFETTSSRQPCEDRSRHLGCSTWFRTVRLVSERLAN